MKRSLFIFIILLLSVSGYTQKTFEKYFEPKTLRVDFTLAGDSKNTELFLEQLKKQGPWAGSRTHLVDERNYGNFRCSLTDAESGEVIYSTGFGSLFQEWQTTAEAEEISRSYYHVLLLPFPKRDVNFKIEMRNWDGGYEELINLPIDPRDYFIVDEAKPDYPVKTIMENGKHQNKVDLVFLPEGYTADEMGKFEADIKRLTDYMFAMSPYDKHKTDFNLYAVMVPSAESGTDIPGDKVYKNTAFNSTFYTFDSPRYLTTRDLKSVHDAAAAAVYDQVYVLVNSATYGGGGFYNYLNLTSVDNERSPQVFVHEFGHGFAGLADEYYSSDVSYEEFYNLKVEPWEPNITTLVDFDRKWKSMIEPGTPQPTLRTAKYSKVIGVFEGGGYTAKGIYSPMIDCRMKTNEAAGFCPVCSKAIEEAIRLNCE